MVTVEIPRAYTDGSSRLAQVFVSYEETAGKARDELLAIVRRGLDADPIAALVGAELTKVEPAPAREDRIGVIRQKLDAIDSKIDTSRTTIERGRP